MRTLMAQQPNYAPYLGFFDRAARADVLVLQDDLNYTKQDWQNRNRIRAADGWRWLSIPVHGSHRRSINATRPAARGWLDRHLRILRHEYGPPALDRLDALAAQLRPVAQESLAVLNERLIRHLLGLLGIDVTVVRQSELEIPRVMEPNDRLVRLCELLDCDRYLSGTGGRNYIDIERWLAAGIRLDEHRFVPVPYGPDPRRWRPDLSALDLLLTCPEPRASFEAARHRSGAVPWTADLVAADRRCSGGRR